MHLALFIILSFAPGFFWLWFFLRLNKVRPTPKRFVALSFILGMISTVPAGLIERYTLPGDLFSESAGLTGVAMAMLLVVGPVEETSKFLMVRLGVYRSSYFQQPVDGLVHSTATALGFASLENLLYVMMFGPVVMVARGPLSTVAHLVFGSLWGYGLGVHQQSGRTKGWFVLATLAGAAVLHATFNIAAFTGTFAWVSPLLVLFGAIWAYRRFEWGQRISPFRFRRNYPLVPCNNCNQPMRVVASFCPNCGHPNDGKFSEIICGNCKHENRPDALYCARCGDRFLTK